MRRATVQSKSATICARATWQRKSSRENVNPDFLWFYSPFATAVIICASSSVDLTDVSAIITIAVY